MNPMVKIIALFLENSTKPVTKLSLESFATTG
jgi:hypothetical protein